MRHFRKPSLQHIQAFLEKQRRETFTYPEVGLSRTQMPAGYAHDHNRILLGKGRAVFADACDAIRRWQMFPGTWACIEPPDTTIQEGNVVALLIHVFGLWWLNAARIVYVLDETDPIRRFGFAYGTLPGHVECGEELFSVVWRADDTIWYDLRAFSRPRYWVVRLGYPLARRLQRRFARESLAAMRRVVGARTEAGVGR